MNFDFPGKNWSFTAMSGQIILFLFKSHHFRTYFLYMIMSLYMIDRWWWWTLGRSVVVR